jgi:Ca-activated chloride channel homolog
MGIFYLLASVIAGTFDSYISSMRFTFSGKVSGFLVVLIFFALEADGQNTVQQKLPEKTRVLFVMDGSGSMEALWGPSESRMDIAKRIMVRLIDSLRANPDLELALRIYGHRYSRQANNCQDSKLEVPFGLRNHAAIIDKIKEVRPRGVTPITYSLEQAANDFPASKGYRNILILITDGIEGCGGDPCSVSVALQKKGVFLRPFIIGLGIAGGKVLECMGTYIDSKDAESFNEVLNESIETTFAKTTVSVELLNGAGIASETNVNITLLNNMTGVAAYDFVHYLDKRGKPDTVQIDPVLHYDFVVNTLPPLAHQDVKITNGTHNLIRIPVPQGTLVVRSDEKGNRFSLLVRQKGKSELLNQQNAGEAERYLAGEYSVETLTLPRRIFDVSIEADRLKTITLPQPGLVNINTLSGGFGSLFEILETGESKFVIALEQNRSLHSYNLLPGNYKIAFRVKQAAGSKYTATKHFEVKSGQTSNISLF